MPTVFSIGRENKPLKMRRIYDDDGRAVCFLNTLRYPTMNRRRQYSELEIRKYIAGTGGSSKPGEAVCVCVMFDTGQPSVLRDVYTTRIFLIFYRRVKTTEFIATNTSKTFISGQPRTKTVAAHDILFVHYIVRVARSR